MLCEYKSRVGAVSRRQQNEAQLNSQQVSFIGNLSSPQSLLLIVLLASLLAILFTVLKSGLAEFRLGLTRYVWPVHHLVSVGCGRRASVA